MKRILPRAVNQPKPNAGMDAFARALQPSLLGF